MDIFFNAFVYHKAVDHSSSKRVTEVGVDLTQLSQNWRCSHVFMTRSAL